MLYRLFLIASHLVYPLHVLRIETNGDLTERTATWREVIDYVWKDKDHVLN